MDTCCKRGWTSIYYVKWNESDAKGHILYEYCMNHLYKCLERQICREESKLVNAWNGCGNIEWVCKQA